MTELQRPPTTTTLVELKETIGSFAQSIDHEVKQVVLGIRRRARACLERNGAAFEETVVVGLIAWYSADLSLCFVC